MAQTIDILDMFKQAALDVDNRKLPQLTRDTVIATLGMDSVAVMELVSYFEEKLGVRIPDEELARIRTVGDLRDTVARLLPPWHPGRRLTSCFRRLEFPRFLRAALLRLAPEPLFESPFAFLPEPLRLGVLVGLRRQLAQPPQVLD